MSRARGRVELDRVGAQAHRPAEVGDLLLLGQQVDDRPLGLDVELGRVRAVHAGHVAGELADGDLHAEADAQVGDPALAGDPDGADLALDAAAAEAAGDEDAVGAGEALLGLLVGLEGLGVDPVDLDPPAVEVARVAQRLRHRQVGVLELRRTCRRARSARACVGGVGARDDLRPLAQVGRLRLEPKRLDDEVVDALLVVPERHLVDVVDVLGRDDRVDGQRGEERDLLADVEVQRGLGAAEQHVGLDADAAQLVDRVLGRLRLQLARVADVGHEREVDEEAVPAADVDGELADRLEEGQRLDVAHRAADLGDDDVDVALLGDEPDALLDLVGDVRDDLDRAAEVVAAALAPDDRVVDAARGDVRGARRVRVREALVVAEVEVGLRAVLGHEDLAVLVRRHRAGVDVDVGIELLQADGEPAGDEQAPDGRGRDPLPQGRDDAAGDEDVAGLALGVGHGRSP